MDDLTFGLARKGLRVIGKSPFPGKNRVLPVNGCCSLLLSFALTVSVGACLGFYMGWFHFSSGSDDNNAHVTVSVDKGQIQKDKDKAVDKVQDLGQQAKDKVATTTQKARDY